MGKRSQSRFYGARGLCDKGDRGGYLEIEGQGEGVLCWRLDLVVSR